MPRSRHVQRLGVGCRLYGFTWVAHAHCMPLLRTTLLTVCPLGFTLSALPCTVRSSAKSKTHLGPLPLGLFLPPLLLSLQLPLLPALGALLSPLPHVRCALALLLLLRDAAAPPCTPGARTSASCARATPPARPRIFSCDALSTSLFTPRRSGSFGIFGSSGFTSGGSARSATCAATSAAGRSSTHDRPSSAACWVKLTDTYQ